jgi:hypothetical protein
VGAGGEQTAAGARRRFAITRFRLGSTRVLHGEVAHDARNAIAASTWRIGGGEAALWRAAAEQSRRARGRAHEREGGGEGVGELPCYLAKLWGGELVEKKARGRRRNGDDSQEERHHDEEDDELSTRVVSDFTGDARMRRMVGFWGKNYFRDSQTRSLPMGSLYFCVELS